MALSAAAASAAFSSPATSIALSGLPTPLHQVFTNGPNGTELAGPMTESSLTIPLNEAGTWWIMCPVDSEHRESRAVLQWR